jgi:hypothetical protein
MWFTDMLIVIQFVSNKLFGLVNTGMRGSEGYMIVDRNEKALSTIIHTIHGTFFHDLSIGV